MNLLFVHQNFPGQFVHLAQFLARAGHQVHALAIGGRGLPEINMHRYRPRRSTGKQTHHWARTFETKVIRGEACAEAASRLKAQGFVPDVIVTVPNWGESLFLKDVWPRARVLALIEFFYAAHGLDAGFDPEFYQPGLARDARIRAENAHLLMSLEDMDWGFSPTHFQRSTVPKAYRDRISVIFDGVDTNVTRPDAASSLTLSGRTLRCGDEVVTFVSRDLEPYRGYHIFMRALPEILRRRPNAIAVIMGGDRGSYGAAAPKGATWKQIFLDEVKDRLDLGRVIFPGKVAYADYLKMLQVSACHVYLTRPFVLGWSCVEALSAGCLVVGSATPPVEEVITHGENGLLVNFFDIAGLAEAVVDALARPRHYAPLREAARTRVIAEYDLATVCLPQQVRLVAQLANGDLSY